MKIFESLDKVSNEEMESKILKKWKSEDILNKTIENRKVMYFLHPVISETPL